MYTRYIGPIVNVCQVHRTQWCCWIAPHSAMVGQWLQWLRSSYFSDQWLGTKKGSLYLRPLIATCTFLTTVLVVLPLLNLSRKLMFWRQHNKQRGRSNRLPTLPRLPVYSSLPPDCISSTASHLPKQVQRTVDVDIYRRRYERGDESGSVQGHGAMVVLEGWKVAVEALDQSHRCVVDSRRGTAM